MYPKHLSSTLTPQLSHNRLYTPIPPHDVPTRFAGNARPTHGDSPPPTPPPYVNGPVDAATIIAFEKVWYSRKKIYTGKLYDLLDGKSKVFEDICFYDRIRATQFHAIFPCILSGRAEDYYIYFTTPSRAYSQWCIRS